MSKKLQNKIALITGGSRGIGAAIAKRFAKEGCSVAISYTSSKEKANALVNELKTEGVQAIAIQADQGNPTQIVQLIKKVVDQFGRIDILVNNAGVYAGSPIDDHNTNLEHLAKLFAINVTGVFLTTHEATPYIPDGGRIITIGSIAAEKSFGPGAADYCATKAALLGYTRGWARDLGHKNITVNLVQPGPIDTDMNPDNTPRAEEFKEHIPLARYGQPEEIASGVLFLASSEASYINGTTLTIDGGLLA